MRSFVLWLFLGDRDWIISFGKDRLSFCIAKHYHVAQLHGLLLEERVRLFFIPVAIVRIVFDRNRFIHINLRAHWEQLQRHRVVTLELACTISFWLTRLVEILYFTISRMFKRRLGGVVAQTVGFRMLLHPLRCHSFRTLRMDLDCLNPWILFISDWRVMEWLGGLRLGKFVGGVVLPVLKLD